MRAANRAGKQDVVHEKGVGHEQGVAQQFAQMFCRQVKKVGHRTGGMNHHPSFHWNGKIWGF